jgi:hypothetical protein
MAFTLPLWSFIEASNIWLSLLMRQTRTMPSSPPLISCTAHHKDTECLHGDRQPTAEGAS